MLLGANAINKFYKIENIFYNIYFIQIIIHSMLHEQFEYKGENYIIIIGKNKSENFIIIDESFATDIWFHIEHEPSCHVILKNTLKIRDIPKVVIKRCAYLCKINSKAKTQKKLTLYILRFPTSLKLILSDKYLLTIVNEFPYKNNILHPW